MYDREWWEGSEDEDPDAPLVVDPRDLPSPDEVVVHERFYRNCAHRSFKVVRKERTIRAPNGVTVFRQADFIVCQDCSHEQHYREKGEERPVSPPEVFIKSFIPQYSKQELGFQLMSRHMRESGWDLTTRGVGNGYRCKATKGSITVEVKEPLPTEAEAVCRLMADIARAGYQF